MSLLVFSGLTFRIHESRYRRTAIRDGMLQYPPNGLAKPAEFCGMEPRCKARRVNARLP